MASSLNLTWKNEIMKGTAAASLNGTGTTGVYAVLVDTGVYSPANWTTHQFFSQLSGVVSPTAVELTSKTFGTVSAGTFDAADITFTNVPTANNAEAIVLYVQNAGANSTWQLVAYIDTASSGLPVTPNGGNITVTWNASGIFTL